VVHRQKVLDTVLSLLGEKVIFQAFLAKHVSQYEKSLRYTKDIFPSYKQFASSRRSKNNKNENLVNPDFVRYMEIISHLTWFEEGIIGAVRYFNKSAFEFEQVNTIDIREFEFMAKLWDWASLCGKKLLMFIMLVSLVRLSKASRICIPGVKKSM